MNRGMKFVLVLLSIGILNGPMFSPAEEAPQAPKESGVPPPARRGKLTNIKAVVTEVDPGSSSIKVREGSKDGNEYTVNLTEKTIVTAGKIKKSISDIKPGDKIVARVLNEDGKITARSIRLSHEVRKGRKESAAESKAQSGIQEKDKPAEPAQTPTPGLPSGAEGTPKAGE